ncbi:MAG: hypothetical protein IC227_07485 [Enterococcus lacertideformus]|uniref:PqqD family peptide modification chaperone n=1 Tax=Enterococcus lacertideformus TaxID=2771493 RepID=A0A931AYN1_9ENTE|nr:hypothetical protein [Enterococcus lacertideformus]
MRLNGELAYERLGKKIYLSLNNEVYILDNEVSIYIFELLKKRIEINNIKERVISAFANTEEYTNEEKKIFIEEFIADLINNKIFLLEDETNKY